MSRVARAAGAAALGLALAGCSIWRPTTVPMRVLSDAAPCATPADTLLVMLPGSFDEPEDFVKQGFVAAVRERRLKVDLAIVDAHVGYYADKTVIDRLQADVVAPARANAQSNAQAGRYAHIWFAGISIGALGSMLFAEAHPEGIDGVAVLGPYLGTRMTSNEIERAGGLARWTPPSGQLAPDDVDTRLWRWLKPADAHEAPPLDAPPRAAFYLGYGLDDRFAYSDALLAAALRPDQVFTTEGGHDWPTWRLLWDRMLDAMPLPRDASCPAPPRR